MLEKALGQNLQTYYAYVFERFKLRDRLRKFFERFDVLLSPTLPVSSLDAGRNAPPGLEHRGPIAWSYYTYPFNLSGQPALSLCAGFASDGLPVGLQIVGPMMREDFVLRTAASIERMKPSGFNLIRRP
jgi:aspartyl-tRNA(Asn)/glutamyl-tRNA(Gln) amidotransferase subunit A